MRRFAQETWSVIEAECVDFLTIPRDGNLVILHRRYAPFAR